MAKLMGDHARHLALRDIARAVFVIEPPGDEDASVRGGQSVDRRYFVDMHPHPLNIERLCQPLRHGAQTGVREFGGFLVQLSRRAPDRKAVHGEAVEQGQQDGSELDHVLHMVSAAGAASGIGLRRRGCDQAGGLSPPPWPSRSLWIRRQSIRPSASVTTPAARKPERLPIRLTSASSLSPNAWPRLR